VNFPAIEHALAPGKHRIANIHRNVPGVIGDITHLISEAKANIFGQVLATDQHVGYLVMDLDQQVGPEVEAAISSLPTSIKTRRLAQR
jgi:D-3-phosphoglycerate dehydrogenase